MRPRQSLIGVADVLFQHSIDPCQNVALSELWSILAAINRGNKASVGRAEFVGLVPLEFFRCLGVLFDLNDGREKQATMPQSAPPSKL